jgi:hypothetical protein
MSGKTQEINVKQSSKILLGDIENRESIANASIVDQD